VAERSVTTAVLTGRRAYGGGLWLTQRREPSLSTFTIYTTQWCGYCYRLKSGLSREGIAFEEIDIEVEPAAADIVTSINNGNRTVPTVVFSDGTAMTNPSVQQVSSKLAALS
jgi:mycoredoxin